MRCYSYDALTAALARVCAGCQSEWAVAPEYSRVARGGVRTHPERGEGAHDGHEGAHDGHECPWCYARTA